MSEPDDEARAAEEVVKRWAGQGSALRCQLALQVLMHNRHQGITVWEVTQYSEECLRVADAMIAMDIKYPPKVSK